MQHLKVLDEAGLVVAERRGANGGTTSPQLPIKRIYDRWISRYAGPALELLDQLDRNVAARHSD